NCLQGNAAALNQQQQRHCTDCQRTFARFGPRRRRLCCLCSCNFCASCLAIVARAGRVQLGTKRPLLAAQPSLLPLSSQSFWSVLACRRCQILSNPNFTFADLVSLGAANLRWFLQFVQVDYGDDDIQGDRRQDGDAETSRLANIIIEHFGPNSDAATQAVQIQQSQAKQRQPPNELVTSLSQIDSQSQLDGLSIKEVKHLLAKNRVDYRGCIERSELLDRLRRLWLEHSASRLAVERDSVHNDDLCKICMDATVDCVLLECGHMVACVACGKRCAECPVCRQNVVRVVRTFKS
uniref:RING-type domain-containing protein n=2 Tax=Macrostomum lignano TaxID=282301 RepID=A0A1I8FZC5_9PLAT